MTARRKSRAERLEPLLSDRRPFHDPVPLLVSLSLVIVNLVLALLVTRFVQSAMVLQTNDKVTLPPRAKVAPDPSTQLTLHFRADGIVFAGDTVVTGDDLPALLQANAGKRLFIVADKAAKFADMKEFLQKLRALGVKNAVFSVRDPGTQRNAGPGTVNQPK